MKEKKKERKKGTGRNLIGVGKKKKKDLVKWKLESNTTRIGQNLKGVGKRKKTGNIKCVVNGNGGKKRKKRRIKEVNLTAC